MIAPHQSHMNKRSTRKLTRMKRVFQFCKDLQLDPTHPAVIAESNALGTCIAELETAAVNQAGGTGSITGAVDHRLMVVKDLHRLMASLAKTAKRLDRNTYPEIAGKMRMRGATDSFPKLLTRALLFKETLSPIKAAFIALGAPADVEGEIDTLITAFQAAGTRKIASVGTQIGGTLSIEAKAREGIGHIQQLDAIFTQLFRKDPVMLAQWNIVKRATPYPTAATTPDPVSSIGSTISATGDHQDQENPPSVNDRNLMQGCLETTVPALHHPSQLERLICIPKSRNFTSFHSTVSETRPTERAVPHPDAPERLNDPDAGPM